MIVWGTSGKKKQLSAGAFYCPVCEDERQYIEWRVAKYFDVFWIPLFMVDYVGEPFIECQTCKETFKTKVLEYRPPDPGDQFWAWFLGQLQAGMPLHIMRRRLTQDGMEARHAAVLIDAATEDGRTVCPGCAFEYVTSVDQCPNCGANLVVQAATAKPDEPAIARETEREVEVDLPTSTALPSARYCGQCGKERRPEWVRFCGTCGAPLQGREVTGNSGNPRSK
jgi:hypothetical protein